MYDLGKVKFILGIEVDQEKDCGALMIRQTQYIDDVVRQSNQQDVKAVANP